MDKNNNREIEFDILRILAILAVIMIHVSASFVINYPQNSFQFILGNIFDSVSRIGVPFFILISGTFMLDNNRELQIGKLTKKILKLFVLLVIWSAFYALKYNFHDFINAFVYGHYHLWYLYFIIGLYLTTPIIRKITQPENIKLAYYFIFLSLIFSYIPRTLDGLFSYKDSISDFTNLFSLKLVAGLSSYYIAGWLIRYDAARLVNYKRIFKYAGILSLVLIIIFTQLKTTTNFHSFKYFYDNANLLVFIYSISLFIVLKEYFSDKIKLINDNMKRIIVKLSNLTLGVYLVHVCIINLLMSITKKISINSSLLQILFLFFGTAVISFLICYIISKIKYINKLIKL